MLSDSPAIATIPVKDLGLARAFYSEKLGLKIEEDIPGVITYRSGGARLFVYQSELAGTNRATAATWEVKDVAALVKDLAAKGLKFEHYPNLPGLKIQGDLHIGDGMTAAWLKDPDGNILALVSG